MNKAGIYWDLPSVEEDMKPVTIEYLTDIGWLDKATGVTTGNRYMLNLEHFYIDIDAGPHISKFFPKRHILLQFIFLYNVDDDVLTVECATKTWQLIVNYGVGFNPIIIKHPRQGDVRAITEFAITSNFRKADFRKHYKIK